MMYFFQSKRKLMEDEFNFFNVQKAQENVNLIFLQVHNGYNTRFPFLFCMFEKITQHLVQYFAN